MGVLDVKRVQPVVGEKRELGEAPRAVNDRQEFVLPKGMVKIESREGLMPSESLMTDTELAHMTAIDAINLSRNRTVEGTATVYPTETWRDWRRDKVEFMGKIPFIEDLYNWRESKATRTMLPTGAHSGRGFGENWKMYLESHLGGGKGAIFNTIYKVLRGNSILSKYFGATSSKMSWHESFRSESVRPANVDVGKKSRGTAGVDGVFDWETVMERDVPFDNIEEKGMLYQRVTARAAVEFLENQRSVGVVSAEESTWVDNEIDYLRNRYGLPPPNSEEMVHAHNWNQFYIGGEAYTRPNIRGTTMRVECLADGGNLKFLQNDDSTYFTDISLWNFLRASPGQVAQYFDKNAIKAHTSSGIAWVKMDEYLRADIRNPPLIVLGGRDIHVEEGKFSWRREKVKELPDQQKSIAGLGFIEIRILEVFGDDDVDETKGTIRKIVGSPSHPSVDGGNSRMLAQCWGKDMGNDKKFNGDDREIFDGKIGGIDYRTKWRAVDVVGPQARLQEGLGFGEHVSIFKVPSETMTEVISNNKILKELVQIPFEERREIIGEVIKKYITDSESSDSIEALEAVAETLGKVSSEKELRDQLNKLDIGWETQVPGIINEWMFPSAIMSQNLALAAQLCEGGMSVNCVPSVDLRYRLALAANGKFDIPEINNMVDDFRNGLRQNPDVDINQLANEVLAAQNFSEETRDKYAKFTRNFAVEKNLARVMLSTICTLRAFSGRLRSTLEPSAEMIDHEIGETVKVRAQTSIYAGTGYGVNTFVTAGSNEKFLQAKVAMNGETVAIRRDISPELIKEAWVRVALASDDVFDIDNDLLAFESGGDLLSVMYMASNISEFPESLKPQMAKIIAENFTNAKDMFDINTMRIPSNREYQRNMVDQFVVALDRVMAERDLEEVGTMILVGKMPSRMNSQSEASELQ
ncbi:hypothetical protein HYV64_00055 [Candidatus Shapirobacteria bacterium]|nr:hypothetical protein [Candidatus Shapirobacteria bacterium]